MTFSIGEFNPTTGLGRPFGVPTLPIKVRSGSITVFIDEDLDYLESFWGQLGHAIHAAKQQHAEYVDEAGKVAREVLDEQRDADNE